MLRSRPARRFVFVASFALACCVIAIQASAQASFSALPPTSAPQIAPLNATAPQPDAVTRAHRADVTYDAGLLSINADNSSLNQILREISRQTGMKITGGVHEERVFGRYGPAPPDAILATLIDGNSTNMVLLQTASNAPAELILTPRAGGPSPPNPNAGGFDEGTDNNDGDSDRRLLPLQRGNFRNPNQVPPPQVQTLTPNPGSVPPSIPQPANNINGSPFNTSPTADTLPVTNSVPTDAIPTPSTTPSTNGIVDAPNPPSTDSTTPTTTDGVKTPQQIFEELQQLRQQQQKPKGQ